MLNFIRQKRDKFKWVLWIVIAGLAVSMLIFFVPSPSGAGEGEELRYLVKIGNKEVALDEYRVAVNIRMIEQPNLQKMPNIRRNKMFINDMLRRIILEQVEQDEAARLGLSVTDDEIRTFIGKRFSDDKGQFNFDNYQKTLNNYGIVPEQFEDHVRRLLVSTKYRDFVSAPAAVSDEEVREEFVNENDKAKIRYITFRNTDFYKQAVVTDEQARKYYEANKDKYKIGETRTVQYLFFDAIKAAAPLQMAITDKEVSERVKGNRDKYPPRVHAAHILIKIDDKASDADKEAARKKADEILAKAKAPGADFAALAIEFSQDEGSGKMGGDLNYFTRETMVKEFSDAAFELKNGEISNLVKTNFGWHIIKMIESDDSKYYNIQARQEIAREKAFEQLRKPALRAMEKIRGGASMEAVAKEVGAEVRTSKPFNKERMDYTLGNPEGFVDEMFKLKVNELGTLARAHNGYLVARLTSIIPEHIMPLDMVKSTVTEAVRDEESHKLAAAAVRQFLADVKAAGNDFEKVAADRKLTVTTTELFSRNGQIDRELAECKDLKVEAFRLKPTDLGGPVKYQYRQIGYQVLERVQPDMAKLPAETESLRTRLLYGKKLQIYSAIMQNIYKEYKKEGRIKINEKLVEMMSGEQQE